MTLAARCLISALGFVISSMQLVSARASTPTFPEATTISVEGIGSVAVECRIERKADDSMTLRIDQRHTDGCRFAAFDWQRTSLAKANARSLQSSVQNSGARCTTDHNVTSHAQCGVAIGQTFAYVQAGASCRVKGDNMVNGCALLDSCRAVLQQTLSAVAADSRLTTSLNAGVGNTSPLEFVALFNRKAEELGCASR